MEKTETQIEGKISATVAIKGLHYFSGDAGLLADSLAQGARAHWAMRVFTPGATVAAQADRDGALRALLQNAEILLADGYGCRFAARLCGVPLPPRVAGIDFAEMLLARGNAFGARVFLYGAAAGVALRAAVRLGEKYPRILFEVADGYGRDPVERVRAFSPHFVFVCLGVPRQEAWIDRHVHSLGAVCLGLGGSFDVWANDVRRAPRALRKMGLEWAYRTVLEPHRLPRLFPLPRYFLGCLGSRFRG